MDAKLMQELRDLVKEHYPELTPKDLHEAYEQRQEFFESIYDELNTTIPIEKIVELYDKPNMKHWERFAEKVVTSRGETSTTIAQFFLKEILEPSDLREFDY